MDSQSTPQTTSSSSASTPQARAPHSPGFFSQVQVILGVALVLATLFTLWSPGEFTPPRTPAAVAVQATRVLPTPTEPGSPTATPRARPLIGIVSGHWGNDSGAVCPDGLTEAEVNQRIATLVQRQLLDQGFDVDVLKEFDEKLTGYAATALVSIHNDSCAFVDAGATGFKVASAMASANPEEAARLSACLRSRYGQATGMQLHTHSVTEDMTEYHAFAELDAITSAAIIETGFLNLDRQFLLENTDQVAKGIVDGILCFINKESIFAEGETGSTPAATPGADIPGALSPTVQP